MARTGAPSTTRRTLHYFWLVTRKHLGLFAALMTATFLFVALLSYGNPYVMSLVVDRVSAGSVAPDEVFAVFGPYIAALILINVAGQAASKVQDLSLIHISPCTAQPARMWAGCIPPTARQRKLDARFW